MPVDCQYAKMILYSIILQCIDPVLTIVSASTEKDVFVLPQREDKEKIAAVKRKFAEDSLSDHKMALNVFNKWYAESNRKKFSDANFISNENMQTIASVRNLIIRHLETAGYIVNDHRSHRAWENLNKNSMHWEIVKACLTAALYPNVCEVSDRRIYSQNEPILPHMSSVINALDAGKSGKLDEAALNAQWLVYGNKTSNQHSTSIRNITLIPPINLLVFVADFQSSLLENSCETNALLNDKVILKISEMIKFAVDRNAANLLLVFQSAFSSMFSRFLLNYDSFEPEDKEENLIKTLCTVIFHEDYLERTIRVNQSQYNYVLNDFFDEPGVSWQKK